MGVRRVEKKVNMISSFIYDTKVGNGRRKFPRPSPLAPSIDMLLMLFIMFRRNIDFHSE